MHPANHIVVFVLLIVVPIFVYFDIRRLRVSTDPRAKEKAYLKSFVFYWGMTFIILAISPFGNMWTIAQPFHFHWFGKLAVVITGVYFLLFQVLPWLLLPVSARLRKLTADAFAKKSHIYPTTSRQRALFIAIPITVGICEEIIFRGYLFHYFQSTPYFAGSLVSFLLVTFIFGLEHFTQGIDGIIETMLLGFLLGVLYFLTGSLILPIILHILYDSKILVLNPAKL